MRFNLINPETNNRIRMKTVDAGSGEEVSRSELVKGYKIAKDEYVLLSQEELEAVRLESTHTIDIEKFVPREQINRLYWDTPYHLLPSSKTGTEAFGVIREAMKRKDMVALGRLVMSARERICALEVEEEALLLTTLRASDEVRDASEFSRPELPKPDARMLEIAGKIIDQQAGDFDPAEFRDRYEDALRALIEEKRKGRPVRAAPETARDERVVDLMDALKKSLTSGPRPRAANRNKPSSGRRRAA